MPPDRDFIRDAIADELLDMFGISIQDLQGEAADRLVAKIWPMVDEYARKAY